MLSDQKSNFLLKKINIRDIIAYSQNVPEVKIMKELTPGKSIDYLRNFGISTLYKTGEDPKKDDESLPLAIRRNFRWN